MKKAIVFLTLLTTIGCSSAASQAGGLSAEALKFLEERYHFFTVIPSKEGEPMRYAYADIGPHVHVYEVTDGAAESVWETGNMGSPITGLVLADIEKDGNLTIVVSTLQGRLIGYSAETYERVFENFQEPFKTISCFTLENVDGDPQDEFIIVGQRLLAENSTVYIFDSVTRGLEWESPESFKADEIVVANVDSDPQPELILNSGFVIDSRFYNIDLIKREAGGFGRDITLQDLNGDGYPEIIGRVANRTLQIYDIYAERDIW